MGFPSSHTTRFFPFAMRRGSFASLGMTTNHHRVILSEAKDLSRSAFSYFSTFTIGAATAEKVLSLPLAKRIFTRCSAPWPVRPVISPRPNTRW